MSFLTDGWTVLLLDSNRRQELDIILVTKGPGDRFQAFETEMNEVLEVRPPHVTSMYLTPGSIGSFESHSEC
jgi:hypothetical protein